MNQIEVFPATLDTTARAFSAGRQGVTFGPLDRTLRRSARRPRPRESSLSLSKGAVIPLGFDKLSREATSPSGGDELGPRGRPRVRGGKLGVRV